MLFYGLTIQAPITWARSILAGSTGAFPIYGSQLADLTLQLIVKGKQNLFLFKYYKVTQQASILTM